MKQQTQTNKIEWGKIELEEVLDYEQPTKYIVESTDYRDEYETPVLTAGKSFILGYTNETKGIHDKLPVIIFDDFTTDKKFVDFKFKVKSSAMKILEPKNELINLKFVFLAMQGLKFDVKRHKRYYLSAYQNLKIPMPFTNGKPDIQTQNNVVSILEKAEKLKQNREESDKLTKEYLQSVFYEMFKEKGFPKKNIGELCEVISGSTPSTIKKEYWNGNIDWVTPAELEYGDNYYYYESQRKITKAGLDSASTLFPKETVMLTTRAPIGKVAIAGKEMCTNQGFKNLICKRELNPIYLYCWLLFNEEYINSIGVGATFKEISKKMVEKIKIPLPPMQLQQRFASIVEYVEKLKEKQKKSKEEINVMFDSLMKQTFNGELIK